MYKSTTEIQRVSTGLLYRTLVHALALLLFLVIFSGCCPMQQTEVASSDQSFADSFNFLLDTSSQQAERLEPLWIKYQKTEESLRVMFSGDSDMFLKELDKLNKAIIDEARDHLNAAQLLRLNEILTQKLEWAQKAKEAAEKFAAQCPPCPVASPPPRQKERQPPQGGGPGGGGPPGGGGGF